MTKPMRQSWPPAELNHSLPLAPDDSRWAYLTLPRDLTAAEAERIVGFVQALALDDAAGEVSR